MTREETALLGGRVRLLQPVDGYRVAIDPVMLAACLPESARGLALDVGTGTGAALLCALARCPALHGQGVEIHPPHADLATEALRLNGWADRAAVLTADITARPAPVPGNAFDWVITNPPFHGPGTSPREVGRAGAHMEGVPLADWLAFCLRCLKPQGRLALIYRADRLDDVLAALHRRAGAVEIIPLWPRADSPAKRVIVRAVKGSRAPLALRPGLVLHQADGAFTPQAEAVLRGCGGLDCARISQ